MKRTTVYLDELTDLELARLARQRKRSKAELIREALGSYIKANKPKLSPYPSWVGAGHSGVPDLAEHDEELLGQIYEEKHARITAEWEAREKEKEPH